MIFYKINNQKHISLNSLLLYLFWLMTQLIISYKFVFFRLKIPEHIINQFNKFNKWIIFTWYFSFYWCLAELYHKKQLNILTLASIFEHMTNSKIVRHSSVHIRIMNVRIVDMRWSHGNHNDGMVAKNKVLNYFNFTFVQGVIMHVSIFWN